MPEDQLPVTLQIPMITYRTEAGEVSFGKRMKSLSTRFALFAVDRLDETDVSDNFL